MGKQPREIIEAQLKLPQTTKQFAWLLGIVDNDCHLISRGVRDVGLVSPLWLTDRHRRRYPILKRIVEAAGLNILAVPRVMDSKRRKYWSYFIYSRDGQQKIDRILQLQKKLAEMKGSIRDPRVRAIHREIGKLFGYSTKAVKRQYPK